MGNHTIQTIFLTAVCLLLAALPSRGQEEEESRLELGVQLLGHGEVRNGGIPEWAFTKGCKLRDQNPVFLDLVKKLYQQIFAQVQGLQWKDGGPVIAAQFDNEYRGHGSYLMALKKIATDIGFDLPFYTRTGWPELTSPVPFGEMIPLYGDYADGFWDKDITETAGNYYKAFNFKAFRSSTAIGTDLLELYQEGERLREFLATDPDVTVTSISTDFDELMLTISADNNKLNSLGLTSYEVGMVSAILFNGVDTGNVSIGNEERSNVHICSDITDGFLDAASMGKIPIKTLAGSTVSLEELGDIDITSTVSSIRHTDRALSVTVGATLISEDASGVTLRMYNYLSQNPLKEGIETKSSGIIGLIADSIVPVLTAIAIAIFLLYTVMVIQFERFRQPFIIMLSVPFCLIGVILSLLIFGSTITMMSSIALVALSGTVVNNAIILIDYINQLRDRKRAAIMLGVDESLVDKPGSGYTHEVARGKLIDTASEEKILAMSVVTGSSSRLRPILITTLTTVVGVIPMALALGEGSEIYASVGQSIAGGLLTSTLITLFIIPVIYFIGEKKAIIRKNRRMERSNG